MGKPGRPRIHKKAPHSVKVSADTYDTLERLQKQWTERPLYPPGIGEVVAILVEKARSAGIIEAPKS